MPRPPGQQVVPYRKGLFYPFHNSGQFQAVFGPDKKCEHIARETESPYLKDEAFFCLTKYPVKQRQGLPLPEQWLPVIDSRVNFVPYILFKRT
jgi:hypothetical protein